ncbi:hypothetical protein APUTEX25_001919 [Auxenochlorella protothecoides]|uniref:AB hydrolase-1 domain-containing protein n=1 Tax=Auxenochlorella protothecoides TaxID=3075 RepID=A0A3M7KP27_AUXPR|nr:hypothetical protein APUTEX25_001919 [Auxenochlorella protothecoides]|eukprot:RMZ52303.1 hypothetical protein APUTEX25_001919 [Auxenochlorella protothecoides]
MLSRGVRELARRWLPALEATPATAGLHTEAAQIYSERLASPGAGSGPTADTGTICVVHGLLGVGRNLATLTRTLLARAEQQSGRPWQAVLLDQRCHGRSGHLGLPPPHILAASAEDILRLFSSGLEYADAPDVLIGHSLGGKTWVLDSWPFRARESFGELRDTERVLDAVAAIPQPLPSREALYQRLGEQGFSEGLQQWLGSNLRQRGKGQYVWQFDLEGARSMLEDYCTQDYTDLLTTPPPGTTIHMESVETLRGLAAVPGMADRGVLEYHELPDAGHWVHVDNPQGLLDMIAPSLSKTL